MSSHFKLCAPFEPRGDQPHAIEMLSKGVLRGDPAQVLLGITGSGKTCTMANVIERTQRPTLVLAHNKTLAAQLFQEFKTFFPENAVEYFVSYYDYYQPEAYVARTDTYIEKDMAINEKIDKMRLSATRSLLERRDVVIVSSVSCIYGLGSPEYYRKMNLSLQRGVHQPREQILLHLVEMQYQRTEMEIARGYFRVRGDVIDIFPAYEEDLAIRIEMFDDEIERVLEIDPLTGKRIREIENATIYPSSHHVTPEEIRQHAIFTIQQELESRKQFYRDQGRSVELERIIQRTTHDIKMLEQTGSCKGIENYSRHFSMRQPGDPPPCLLDYFPSDFLLMVDESHQTLPQIQAMANGDRARKQSLVEYGFRLPSAFDNRPLKFEEFLTKIQQVIFVSATPGAWEIARADGQVVEQIIRPTGLLDPIIEVRPAATQVDDALGEIKKTVSLGARVLVTTLTKKLSEELTSYLENLGIKTKYLHSDIDTIERVKIIQELRQGIFDVLVGINLLREGLDIPEVSLVMILDADKEGFLRSETSLIQTCGRAARNAEGRVIMYGDHITRSMERTLEITCKRRAFQESYNQEHGIVPRTVHREITPLVEEDEEELEEQIDSTAELPSTTLSLEELRATIKECSAEMRTAATERRFEDAARWRDKMREYQQLELMLT